MYSKPTSQIIKIALIYAIQDREALLDSYSSCSNYKELKEEITSEINDFRQMLRLRYGIME